MRIVVVGMEEGDPLAGRLAAVRHGTHVIAVRETEIDDALATADLVVLAPGCVASADVVATIHAVRRACGSVPLLAVGTEDRAALAVAILKAGASDYAVASRAPASPSGKSLAMHRET